MGVIASGNMMLLFKNFFDKFGLAELFITLAIIAVIVGMREYKNIFKAFKK